MEDEPESAAVVIDNSGSYEERMLEILRKSPVLRLSGNRTITLNNVRQPTRTQNLSAEAMVKASDLEPTFRTLSVTTSQKRKGRESKYLSRGVSWRQAAGN